MATTAKKTEQPIGLPALSLRVGMSLDLVRKRFRTNPALAELTRKVGRYSFVEVKDVARVRELLEAEEAK